MDELGFIQFWNSLVIKPKEFFSEHFKENQSPYFLLVFAMCALGMGVDRFEAMIAKSNGPTLMPNWGVAWGIIIASGILGGLMYYYFGGWFFNKRVQWSKGIANKHKSRFIYLYCTFPAMLFSVLLAIYGTYAYPNPASYDAATLSDPIIIGGSITLLAMLFYSVRISYTGATTLYQLDSKRAKIWFLYLPITYYALLFTLIFLAFGAFALLGE